MPSMRSGGCLCGHVRYNASGDVKYAIQCYCHDCQKMTGTGHAPQIAVSREMVEISGPLKSFQLKSDAGSDVELGFCSDCGSPIYKTTTSVPDLIYFFVGSLDDPSTFSAKFKVYEDRRQPWDQS